MKMVITEDCKKILIETILEIKKRADIQWDNGTGKKKNLKWADLKKRLLPELLPLNFNVDFACGQTKLPTRKGYCSIGFFRNDLDEEFYPKKIGQGFYIWLGYFFKTKCFELGFGSGDYYDDQNDETLAIQEIDKNKENFSYQYGNSNELIDKFIVNLQDMMSFFNSFNANDFYPSSYFQKEQVSIDDLAAKLQEMYQNAEDKVSSIFLFGIKNWKTIKHNGFSCKDIVLKAQLSESYKTELHKAIKLGELLYLYAPKDENKNFEPLLVQHYLSKHPLNQILYGPPGTGKTYNTIEKALEILGVDTESKSRQELKQLFEDYKTKGQIGFVTFHQNYGYEEFVEGIKPKLDNNNGKIEYEVRNGIFKSSCINAMNADRIINQIDLKTNLWRLYTFPEGKQNEDYFDECVKGNFIYAYAGYGMEELHSKVNNGDYIIIPSAIPGKKSKSIRAFGILGDQRPPISNKGFREVEWKWIATSEDQEIVFNQADFGRPTFRGVEKEKETILNRLQKQSRLTPHILIIDEINRGNVSKIFGELITLIEESKRIGKDEELRVTLPYSHSYSQEPFGVPSNLYIIGTMNTADKSITSLDTALRRRFEFIEMMPDPSKLNGKNIDGIELESLLQAINERIAFLYDREKTIGHTYLLDVKNIDDLKKAFQNRIIPLLQEYFYNDYEAIQAVLNDNGMVKSEENKKREFLATNQFKKLIEERGLDEKKIFEIAPKDDDVWNKTNTYTKIYGADESKKDQSDSNKSDTLSKSSDNQ